MGSGRDFMIRKFVLFLLVFLLREQVTEALTWRSENVFDDVLPFGPDMTSTVETASEMGCARLCQLEPWCNGFLFNLVTGACARHRVVYVKPKQNTSETGWRYFRLDEESVCPGNKDYLADRVTGTCYRLDLSLRNWSAAREACASNKERLVVLEPVEKAQFITQFFNYNTGHTTESKMYSIGARRLNASAPVPASGPDFVWLDGQPVNKTATAPFWAAGKPEFLQDRPFLKLWGAQDLTWSEANGQMARLSICERPFLE